jgi:hypothetical protein
MVGERFAEVRVSPSQLVSLVPRKLALLYLPSEPHLRFIDRGDQGAGCGVVGAVEAIVLVKKLAEATPEELDFADGSSEAVGRGHQ